LLGENAQGENLWASHYNNLLINNVTISRYSNVGINGYVSKFFTVKNTLVQNAENVDASNGGSAIYCDACNDTIFYNNTIKNCGNIGISINAEGTGTTSYRSNISYNVVSNCNQQFFVNCNQEEQDIHNLTVVHNTFYSNIKRSGDGSSLVRFDYAENITFKDNIIQTNATNSTYLLIILNSVNNLYSNYNLFNRTTTGDFSIDWDDKTFSQWQVLGYDANGVRYSANFTSSTTLVPATGSPVCSASSTGSFIGALACGSGEQPEPPVIDYFTSSFRLNSFLRLNGVFRL